MIAYLTGQPKINGTSLIIMVGGVGYEVHVSQSLLSKISQQLEVSLYIYTHVKEEALELFGFENYADKQVFLMLLGVSGVGPKTALLMFDKGSEAIINAIKNADVSFFKAIPRIGKKVAQKIIIELKSKVGGLKDLDLSPASEKQTEIIEALVALGFESDKINFVVRELDTDDLSIEEVVKQAIKKLSQ